MLAVSGLGVIMTNEAGETIFNYGISHFVSLKIVLESVNLSSKGGSDMDQVKIELFLKKIRNEKELTR